MEENKGPEVIRNKREELKYEFKRSYLAWIEAKQNPLARNAEVDYAWAVYCQARDTWLMPDQAREPFY